MKIIIIILLCMAILFTIGFTIWSAMNQNFIQEIEKTNPGLYLLLYSCIFCVWTPTVMAIFAFRELNKKLNKELS